jgi:hypothetical protein
VGLFDADTCRFGFCSLFLMLLVSVVGVCLLIVWSSRVVKNVAQDYSFPDRAKKRKQSGTQSTHFSLNRLTLLTHLFERDECVSNSVLYINVHKVA